MVFLQMTIAKGKGLSLVSGSFVIPSLNWKIFFVPLAFMMVFSGFLAQFICKAIQMALLSSWNMQPPQFSSSLYHYLNTIQFIVLCAPQIKSSCCVLLSTKFPIGGIECSCRLEEEATQNHLKSYI